MKKAEKKYHKLWGCESFLKHDKPHKTIYCSVCGKSNIYKEKITYPYVNYKPWNKGILIWLYFCLLIISPFIILLIVTLWK